MGLYRILLEGGNFRSSLNEKPGLFGFYVARFVRAESLEAAKTQAEVLVRGELKTKHGLAADPESPPFLRAMEGDEVDDATDRRTQPGFVWFPMGESEEELRAEFGSAVGLGPWPPQVDKPPAH
jgi:hypothetical protein